MCSHQCLKLLKKCFSEPLFAPSVSSFTRPSPHARGNVFSELPTPQQLREQEKYKESLRQQVQPISRLHIHHYASETVSYGIDMEFLQNQIEEKRRMEAERREKLRLEEEKEEKRLSEERAHMQRQFEKEQEKERRKEMEVRFNSSLTNEIFHTKPKQSMIFIDDLNPWHVLVLLKRLGLPSCFFLSGKFLNFQVPSTFAANHQEPGDDSASGGATQRGRKEEEGGGRKGKRGIKAAVRAGKASPAEAGQRSESLIKWKCYRHSCVCT